MMYPILSHAIKGLPYKAGFTILETMVAVLISSIIFIAVLFVYDAFARMTHAQQSQADTQEQFMIVRCAIEKDVHMSGYNLPGNGLYPLHYGSSDFTLVFLRNENNKHTTLFSNATIGDSLVLVNDGQGVAAQQWICLEHNSLIVYYQIARVGLHTSTECDTIKLKNSTISAFWDQTATHVHFAKGVYYNLEYQNASWRLIRHASDGDQPLGLSIDSIDYVPKDASGVLAGNQYTNAQILQITLAGQSYVSQAHSRAIKMFDVMVRN
jgi:type II secretory pathway pseudopilin PulG